MKRFITLILVLMLFLTSCGFALEDVFGNDSPDQSLGGENIDSGTNDSDSGEVDVNNPEDNNPEDNNPEDNNPEDNNPEDNNPEDNNPEDNNPEDNNPEDNNPEDSNPDDNNPEDNNPEDNNPEDNNPEDNNPEDNNPEDNNPEDNNPEDNNPEDNNPEDNNPEVTHNYIASVTAPTCEKGGYTTYTCATCGDYYVSDKTDALGHSYKSVVTPPTCVNGGYTTYTCSNCGNYYTADGTTATGHSYKSVVTSPTCEKGGYTTYTCTTCGDYYTSDKTDAAGHNYKTTVKAPTCIDGGYTTYVCYTCSYTYISDNVSALGHSWVDATTEAPKTCTTCGITEGEKLPSSDSGSGGAYSETLYVNYINVGQGDSILIKVGDCDILIDAGTANYGSTVSNYLKSQGVDDIELMINTHPDADHVGGLTTVLNNFVVEEVWMSKDTSKTTAAYKNFVSAVSKEGLTAKKPNAGTVFTYEYLTITVIYSAIGSDSNNSSIVVMLEYGSFRFLFTGDVGEEVETQLVSSGADVECDVLKVGHHGSKYSSTSSFLNAVSADYGVICVGSNSYGHPTSETLNRLSSAGVSVYRTDLNGNIVFSTDGATLYLPDGGTDTSGSGSGTSSGGSSSGGSSSGGSSSDSSSSSQIFIGNTETKVFHLPTCSNLPASSKQNTMYNYWWIINIAGYTPCGRCLKDYDTGSSGTSYIANSESKVYHLSTCSYLPAASKQIVIYSTAGYTPCGHCIKSSTTTRYIANTETKVYHLSTCSYLPAASKQTVIYDTSGYTPCGHCLK